jgi:hypothetical protein
MRCTRAPARAERNIQRNIHLITERRGFAMHVDVMETLQAKAQQIAGTLTPEDWSRLRSMRLEDIASALSSSTQAKAQQIAEGLTPDERAQIRLLLAEARADAAADTAGFRVALYEGDPGNKGRPQQIGPAAGGGNVSGSLLVLGIVALGGILLNGDGEYVRSSP